MRTFAFILAFALGLVALPPHAVAAEGTTVRAILFVASNDKHEPDRRLAAYEPTLRRVLRFESYRFMGQSSASVPSGGTAQIRLQGEPVAVENDNGRIRVSWNGATVNVPRGRPAVLGGRAHRGGGVEGVIVVVD